MKEKRIIPCLDINNGRVVKGVKFENLVDAGDPVEIAKAYELQGADELVLLDINATDESRKITLDVVEKIAGSISIPLIVGVGLKVWRILSKHWKAVLTGLPSVRPPFIRLTLSQNVQRLSAPQQLLHQLT